MKRKMLWASGITALSVASALLVRNKIRNKYKHYPDFMGALHRFNSGETECLLKNKSNFPLNASDLAFIIVNENQILPICLSQYDKNELSNYRIYSDSYCEHSKREIGCTVSYITNLHGYGTLDGIIYCGKYYNNAPNFNFDNLLCDDCLSLINRHCQPYDILLCDLKCGVMYDICGNYRFQIRNYDIFTRENWDRTFKISIVDRNLQAIEKVTKRVWKNIFRNGPRVSAVDEYYHISKEQVIK